MSGKALVTGAAGFIGSNLVDRLLDEGWTVIGLDCLTDYYDPAIKRRNLEPALNCSDFRFLEEDLLEADLAGILDGVDTVFHLAAQAGVRASWGSEFDIYLRQNLAATQRLLETLKGREAVKLVYTSTSSVYGQVDSLPMREDQRPRPFSPYGVTKLAAEQLTDLYRMNFGLRAVALRLFTVYGPRQRPDMGFSLFIDRALRGEALKIYGDGSQTRDFTFVGDIVECFLRAAEYEGDEFVFNAGGGSRVSLAEALGDLEKALDEPLKWEPGPEQPGDVRDTLADTSRIESELGFRPSVPLAEGLARQVAWTREKRLHA